jgi:hypothetical protein
MSYEPTEDDMRKMREVLAKAGAAARALVRIKLDAIEKAAREGTLDDYLEQHGGKALLDLLRRKCAKCDQRPVLHVTDVSSGRGEVTSLDLCEEHAREYRDQLPPQMQ